MSDSILNSLLLVSPKVKEELEIVNDLLCDGWAGEAAVKLGEILDKVGVVDFDKLAKGA